MITTSLMELKKTTTPAEFSAKLQEMGDIFWWPAGNFYVITSYALAKEVLCSGDFSCDRSPFFISRMPQLDLALITDFFKVVGNMMVMSDGNVHQRRRRICYEGFTQHYLQQLIPAIKKSIETCVPKGLKEFDFVNLAETIPATTLAEFFAIPVAERRQFYQWANDMTQFFGGSTTYFNEDGMRVNASARALYDYFYQLLQERRRQNKEDFFSALIKNQHHFGLNDEEIIAQAIMMLVAGQITTTDQMCNNLYLLLAEKHWQQLVAKPEFLAKNLEECNRLDPAVTFIFRVTQEAHQLGGIAIEKGKVIFISTHAVNRDPRMFSHPFQFTPEDKAKHLSYGYGGHFCIGAKLARLEMELVFSYLLKYFPKLDLAEDKTSLRKHHSLSFSGFTHLFIEAA